MNKRYNAVYFLQEGVRAIFTHGAMSVAALCMIVGCLLIMGTSALVAVNVDSMLGTLERDNEFVAYVDETYTRDEAEALEQKILDVVNVSTATFVTREEAMEDFMEGRPEMAILETLPAEVLRDRYEIKVNDITLMAKTVSDVEGVKGVSNTLAAIEVAEGFVMVRNIATIVALVLVGMLLIISLFIIANTVRLATFYRRQEIAIMKMCGATDGFIRWPFVVEGMILGLGGAAIAFGIQWGIYAGFTNLLTQAGGLSIVTIIPFASMAARMIGVFSVTGLLVGVVGSLLAIRRFLHV